MSRKRGHIVAGQVWHITQRCHEQQFLLSCESDRRRWLYWLYQLRQLYGLCVLNYVVTSNHIHLLVEGHGTQSLRACMDLINQRTTEEFNRQHRRCGLVWAPTYQVAAIQTDAHLARCMNYIDMHMVRAGEVEHPSQWRCSGYVESKNHCKRGGRIDHARVRHLLQFDSDKALLKARDQWIRRKLAKNDICREPYWSNSIAVGDLGFALKMKRVFAYTHPGRRPQREVDCYALRETKALWVTGRGRVRCNGTGG